MNSKFIFLVFGIFSNYFVQVIKCQENPLQTDSIQNNSSATLCYVCNSEQDAYCKDPFIPNEDLKPSLCENGEKFCRKIYQEGE
jgi:hypothetical protein